MITNFIDEFIGDTDIGHFSQIIFNSDVGDTLITPKFTFDFFSNTNEEFLRPIID